MQTDHFAKALLHWIYHLIQNKYIPKLVIPCQDWTKVYEPMSWEIFGCRGRCAAFYAPSALLHCFFIHLYRCDHVAGEEAHALVIGSIYLALFISLLRHSVFPNNEII